MSDARKLAEKALRALGKADLLYTHHGNVCVRDEAFDALAKHFEAFAQRRPEATYLAGLRDAEVQAEAHGATQTAAAIRGLMRDAQRRAAAKDDALVSDTPYDHSGTPGRECSHCNTTWPATEPDAASWHHKVGCPVLRGSE